ncbi:RES family NAD+ phosphorylase [Chromobacterium sp. IIBBL 290-4]|uniref:RES family NAD+ phosphorylase n=1 Tax=Chromobacterium sp. IIBBL 290-4 TaxID=2953890 RepID=UPI0020B735F2|nr:RES family NAD+ phosphorylase [Chromobacterium sp. IIBBL 290-4]UTH72331.1 RES family NAD+ phosphorylase [Chromobacterium sp. IIBBL 290-4]
MTRLAWRIATDTPDYSAEDMSGEGAKRTGGRWNRRGGAMLYSAESRALACLETLAHLGAGGLPLNRYLVRLEIPDAVWARAERVSPDDSALVGWDALPAGRVSLDYGDGWLRESRSALLLVPSIIVAEESNILINPAHPDAAAICAVKVRKWQYDARLAV